MTDTNSAVRSNQFQHFVTSTSNWPKVTPLRKSNSQISYLSNKKAVLPQGNHAMPQVFFSVKVRQQHSLQV